MYELKGEPTPLGREDDTGGHVSAAVSEAAVSTQTGMYQQRYQKQLYQHKEAAVPKAAVPMQTGMCQQLYQKQLYQHRQACVGSCTSNSFKTTASQSTCTVPMYLLWLKNGQLRAFSPMIQCSGHGPVVDSAPNLGEFRQCVSS